eukprot:TRINITY_DN2439_c0_g2_i1.p1 TRINITY_DN2439_c0_g2~~TRINITY_DN2439_c0_g2_i1.p1  ORF type:complete len:281 (-),score=24.56 TRINITY_DN2439_c0_g2_i1:158-1000(-)
MLQLSCSYPCKQVCQTGRPRSEACRPRTHCHARRRRASAAVLPAVAALVGAAAGRRSRRRRCSLSAQGDEAGEDAEIPPKSLPKQLSKQLSSETLPEALYRSFFRPKFEDPVLPLADVLISGIIVPAMLVLFCTNTGLYLPRWIVADGVDVARGAFLGPTLMHGAGLSVCWIVGLLSVRGFEGAAMSSRDLGATLTLALRAGVVAALLWWLVMLSQVESSGGIPETAGQCDMMDKECMEADARVIQYYFDATLDIGAEAIILTSWRLMYAISCGMRPSRD